MNDSSTDRAPIAGRSLLAVLVAAALWVVWGLARHPGFQPASWLRLGAPVVALLAGVAFAQAVSFWRARIDGEREVDRSGKALFMGFAMVVATLLAWLLVSQAIPATLTAATGASRSEAGIVSHRVPQMNDADCRFRLVVASASADKGALARPYDECVDEATWSHATDGGPVTLQLVAGAFGAELVGVSR